MSPARSSLRTSLKYAQKLSREPESSPVFKGVASRGSIYARVDAQLRVAPGALNALGDDRQASRMMRRWWEKVDLLQLEPGLLHDLGTVRQ